MVMINVSLENDERSILQLLAQGLNYKEIAIRLDMTDAVLKHRLASSRIRLNAKSTLHAVAIALDKGLVSIRE